MHGELTREFEAIDGVQQGCPISPFTFDFVIHEAMDGPLGFHDVGMELARAGKFRNID